MDVKKPAIVFAVFCLAFISCLTEPQESGFGFVKGTITSDDPTGFVSPVEVGIEGTNISATSTQNGKYSLLGVPAGSYILKFTFNNITAYTLLRPITVVSGETTFVEDVQFEEIAANYVRAFSSFKAFKEGNVQLSSVSMLGLPRSSYVEADSLRMQFKLVEYASPSILFPPKIYESQVTIMHNGSQAYSQFGVKGDVSTPYFKLSDADTFLVLIPSDTLGYVCTKSIKLSSENRISICFDSIYLSRTMKSSTQNYLVTDSGNVYVSLRNLTFPDSIDFDLYLINDSSHDSCYWRNPGPDWGVADSTYDNPILSGDKYNNTGYSSNTGSESIKCNNLSPGSYTIAVKNYNQGSLNPLRPIPNLIIMVGYSADSYRLRGLFTVVVPTGFKTGDFWVVGKLRIPAVAFDTSTAGVL